MIFTSHPIDPPSTEMFDFLRQRLGLSENAIDLGVRQAQIENTSLPIILWSFGLINRKEYLELIHWQLHC